MFYSEAILARRGPLARVWLAAHMERKLSKSQTLQTDITQSVGAIMGQDVEVMALRLSGQLLLGVVRIYSRKAKYLLDDCNEALLKIKMAFRPAAVDMTEDQLAANKNAITLPEVDLDLDLMLPDLAIDFDMLEAPATGQHIARQADITLVNANDLQMDFDSLDFGVDIGEEDGIGSQDFDLGLDFGDVETAEKGHQDADDSISVEVGRDAPSGLRDSRFSVDMLLDHDALRKTSDVASPRSRDASEAADGVANFDFDVDMDANIDLGLNFGDGNDEQVHAEKPVETRASSPLTELPETPPPEGTPRAGDHVEGIESTTKKKPERRPKDRKQIIDADIELKGGSGSKLARKVDTAMGSQSQKDVSAITTKQRFLPASRTVMRLLEIRSDPVAYFMPMKPGPGGNLFFNAGPPGLAPELTELFMRPITNLHLAKRRGEDVNGRPSKKPRLGEINGEVDDVEIGRREASVARSIGLLSDLHPSGGDIDFGPMEGHAEDFQMGDDFRFDASAEMHQDNLDLSKTVGDETRVSTPAADLAEELETYADVDCQIATFDDRPSQPTQPQDEANDIDEHDQKKGYSKNTMKALSILRREFDPKVNPEGGDKFLSFSQISEKASRRAASSFFFELLVLGTRDCLKLSQAGPFENIEIRAKDRLWEHNLRTERLASVAPSMVSTM